MSPSSQGWRFALNVWTRRNRTKFSRQFAGQFSQRITLKSQTVLYQIETIFYIYIYPYDVDVIHVCCMICFQSLIDWFVAIMIADWPVQLHASLLARCRSSSSPAPRMTGQVGTWRYMAPEVVRREHYNEKVDIYSFGLILYFIFSGKQCLDFDLFRTNFVFCLCGSTWYAV